MTDIWIPIDGLRLRGSNQTSAPGSPVNTALPVISGTPTEGQTLSVTTGTWTGTAPITFSYQWLRNGIDIGGATVASYVAAPADVGMMIACRVTALNIVASSSAQASPVGPIAAQPLSLISGGNAIAGFNFTDANTIAATDQKFIQFGSTTQNQSAAPLRLPAVGADWFQGFFFTIPETAKQSGSIDFLMQVGNTGLTGGNDRYIVWRQGAQTTGGRIELSMKHTTGQFWNQADNPTVALDRGERYMLAFGQIGSFPFFACVRCRDGAVMWNIKGSTANDGANSFYKDGSSVNRWNNTSTFADTFLYAGAAGAVAAGSNRFAFGGAISDVSNVWGTFPNTSGVPAAATLQAIASGELDIPTWAPAQGFTLRYHNRMTFGSLAPDPAGAITTVPTIGGTAATVTPRAALVRMPPSLRIDPLGDGFVFGLTSGQSTASVTVTGTYQTASGSPGMIEMRLVKESDGTALAGFDWQVPSSASATGGVFSGTFLAVPKGVTFRAEARFSANPAVIFASRERWQVGVTVFAVSQSQMVLLLDPANNANSSTTLAPTNSVDRWLSFGRVVGGNSDTTGGAKRPTYGPAGEFGLSRVDGPGQAGDAAVLIGKQINDLHGCSAMVLDAANGGKDIEAYYQDRTIVNLVNPFTPNGATTVFNFTAGLGTITTGMTDKAMLPGSISIVVNGVTITDTQGASNALTGTLAGTGVTGTVNYVTRAIALTFAVAPPAGAVSMAYTYVSELSASNALYGTRSVLMGYGLWGVDTGGNLVANSGQLVDAALRLKGKSKVSTVLLYWWTAMNAAFAGVTSEGGYTTAYNALAARFDAFKARLAAVPGFENAVFVICAPARETNASGTVEPVNSSEKYGWFRRFVKDYVAARAWARFGGEYQDVTIQGNSGPHQDASSGLIIGERMGKAIAQAMGANVEVRGPSIASAAFTDGSRTAIDVTFALNDPAATAIRTRDGTNTGVLGFMIGATFSARVPAADASNGFSAVVTGPTTIRITKTTGAWAAGTILNYTSDTPIFTGTANKTADDAALQKLIFDNSSANLAYAPGNAALTAMNVTVTG